MTWYSGTATDGYAFMDVFSKALKADLGIFTGEETADLDITSFQNATSSDYTVDRYYNVTTISGEIKVLGVRYTKDVSENKIIIRFYYGTGLDQTATGAPSDRMYPKGLGQRFITVTTQTAVTYNFSANSRRTTGVINFSTFQQSWYAGAMLSLSEPNLFPNCGGTITGNYSYYYDHAGHWSDMTDFFAFPLKAGLLIDFDGTQNSNWWDGGDHDDWGDLLRQISIYPYSILLALAHNSMSQNNPIGSGYGTNSSYLFNGCLTNIKASFSNDPVLIPYEIAKVDTSNGTHTVFYGGLEGVRAVIGAEVATGDTINGSDGVTHFVAACQNYAGIAAAFEEL